MYLTKEAGLMDGMGGSFLEGAAKELLDKVGPSSWKERPFETIFGTLGVGVIFNFSWIWGAVAALGEHFGYGPGYIGKLIDNKIKKGGKIDLSDNSLEEASKSAIDEFLQRTQGSSNSADDHFLNDLQAIKGNITENDIFASLYVSGFTKNAGIGDWIGKLYKGLTGSSGAKSSFTGALYGILKTFSKGILAAAAFGGIAHMFFGDGKKENIEKSPETPETSQQGRIPQTKEETTQKQQYYSNVSRNVADTLVKFLDNKIGNFSPTFEKLYKTKVENSPAFREILNTVENMNRNHLEVINSWDAFMAPPLLDMAYKLMPVAKYEKIEGNGKSQTKTPKKVKSPATKSNSVSELKQLLNEV